MNGLKFSNNKKGIKNNKNETYLGYEFKVSFLVKVFTVLNFKLEGLPSESETKGGRDFCLLKRRKKERKCPTYYSNY